MQTSYESKKMELRLEGHFSYIDKYNKLKFTYLDEDPTLDKLRKHCEGSRPFTNSEFTVSIPRGARITDDLRAMIGLDCTVNVRLQPYSFISRLERNRGEKVQGVQLMLLNIRLRD